MSCVFEPVHLHIHQALVYLKSNNKFYADFSIAKGLSSEEMFRFSDIVEIQGQKKPVTEKIISSVTEMSESTSDTETEYSSVEVLLSMHIIALNKTTPYSEIPKIIMRQVLLLHRGNGKNQFQHLGDKFCEEQDFLIFFLRVDLAIIPLKIFQYGPWYDLCMV